MSRFTCNECDTPWSDEDYETCPVCHDKKTEKIDPGWVRDRLPTKEDGNAFLLNTAAGILRVDRKGVLKDYYWAVFDAGQVDKHEGEGIYENFISTPKECKARADVQLPEWATEVTESKARAKGEKQMDEGNIRELLKDRPLRDKKRAVENLINAHSGFLETKALQIKDLEGRDAIIPQGKYKGRQGRVTNPHFSYNGFVAMIKPYRLNMSRPGGLNDHPDARSYWNLEGVEFIKEDEG